MKARSHSPQARLAASWAFAGAASAVAVLPYVLAMQPALAQRIPLPLAWFAAAQFVQSLFLFLLLCWIGLRLGKPLGLDSPLLRAVLYGAPWRLPGRTLTQAAVIGAAAGAVAAGLDRVFQPWMPAMPVLAPIALWERVIASFYGGIGEELLVRLFLMTLIVWLCWRRRAIGDEPLRPWMAWTGILGATLVFGIGHLPATAALWGLTPLIVVRALLLNSIAGVAFGWLYWRRGLEHAVLAHFCADIVLHVVLGTA